MWMHNGAVSGFHRLRRDLARKPVASGPLRRATGQQHWDAGRERCP
jgi:hypothetical protein